MTSESDPAETEPEVDAIRAIMRWPHAEFANWLKEGLRIGSYDPLPTTKASSEVVHFAQLVQRYAPAGQDRVREVTFEALREWSAHDGAEALRDTLVLIGELRASRCLPDIELLLRSKRLLVLHELERVELSQLALNTVAGVGPDRRYASLFSGFITNPEYAAICYFGSYRIDIENAYSLLPELLECYSRAPLRLGTALKRFLVDYLKPMEVTRALPLLLTAARGRWSDLLRALEQVDIRVEQTGSPLHRELLVCRYRSSSKHRFEDLGEPFPIPDAPIKDLSALPRPRFHLLTGGAA